METNRVSTWSTASTNNIDPDKARKNLINDAMTSNTDEFGKVITTSTSTTSNTKKRRRPDLLENADDFRAELDKRGVLYVSRIPPRMGPAKIKNLLSQFGCDVTRVYLVEEDAAVRKQRRRNGGGGGGKRYVEGWVEFADKKICRTVGECLNNTPITNHKRSVHYGDLWNVKYLKGFKWSHLTEKVAYERRVKEHRLRIEMMRAKKENASYKNLVERGKVMDRIEERRRKNGNDAEEDEEGKKKPRFEFRQHAPLSEASDKAAKKDVLDSLVDR